MKKPDKNDARRKQKVAAKKKQRDKKRAALRKGQASTKPKSGLPEVDADVFTPEELVFWLAHGVNYLVSDLSEGLWDPLFEGIYEDPPRLPDPEEIAGAVMAKYQGVKEWPNEGKAALAWSVHDRSVVYIYSREAYRRIQASSPDADPMVHAKEPANSTIWSMFEYLKTKILNRR